MSDIYEVVRRILENWEPGSDGATLEAAVAEWANATIVDITARGNVWVAQGSHCRWLSDREIAEWLAWMATHPAYGVPVHDVLSIDVSIVEDMLDSDAYDGDPERLGAEYLLEIVAQIPATVEDLESSLQREAIVGILTDDGDQYEDIVRLAMHDVHRRLVAEGTAV